MAGTGVPKFVSMKTIGMIIGVIVILVALLVLWNYIRAVFGEYIEVPKKGEKARFMRYMTCAMLMCNANPPADKNDGCNDSKVMDFVVEYDESNNPVKGCQQVCEEVRDIAEKGPQRKYCGRDYAINFTFKGDVTYNANYSVTWETLGKTPCGPFGKMGWQTDISCAQNWESFMPCPCYKCRKAGELQYLGGGLPAGKLLVNNNGCEEVQPTPVYGAIWIPNTMVDEGKCVKGTGSDNQEADDFFKAYEALARCDFEKDQTIYIWTTDADNLRDECYYIPYFDVFLGCCSSPGVLSIICTVYDYTCPQVMICNAKP